MNQFTRDAKRKRRRGAAAVMVVVTVPVLIGMAALTVDVAVMYNTRADLQRAADAAALAGASSLLSDSMLKIRLGSDDGAAALNPSFGADTTVLEATDFRVGYLDLSSATSQLVLNPAAPDHLNAIEVTVRRADGGANGALALFFAPIFGTTATDVTASATAVFDNRVAGYDVSGGWLLPFTIDEEEYEDQLATGPDNYEYDEDTDTVSSGSDGILEIKLYPIDSGPGNFGLLNLPGSSPPCAPELRIQIEEGVDTDDLVEDFGSEEIFFFDDDGDPLTYTLSGNPGLKASLQSNIESRLGEVIGFLLHDADGVTGTGNNLEYPVVALRFGRILDVRLNGGNKYIWIQPASFEGGVILRGSGVTTLRDTAGLVVLAR